MSTTGIGNGLELEQVQPPSDREMMEEIVPQFVNEDQFMVYILTVSATSTIPGRRTPRRTVTTTRWLTCPTASR